MHGIFNDDFYYLLAFKHEIGAKSMKFENYSIIYYFYYYHILLLIIIFIIYCLFGTKLAPKVGNLKITILFTTFIIIIILLLIIIINYY